MKKLFSLLIAILAVGQVFAQQVVKPAVKIQKMVNVRTVSGSVKDTTGAAIRGAVVGLISGSDSVMRTTDINGAFTFAGVKDPSFKLTVSCIGYYTQIKKFVRKPSEKEIYLDLIVLKHAPTILNEVSLKVDTVTYRSADYKANNNARIDELLKKMPGISVSTNGSVTQNGQAITKIRLNGKEYVGGNAAQAIKNLPSEILEKIQIVDDYGNQANMTGIKSGSPDKILNITTSNNINNFWPSESSDESYAKLTENRYQNPYDAPLSTFSVDVDNASYSNVRRFINNGQLPPKDAVRIEEMINYFKYQLPEPKGSEPVAIATELSVAPWAPSHRLLRIGLKARSIATDKLPASNLVFLIDVSGSMNEANKLPLVKESMKMLVQQLREQDKVSLVVYAGAAGLVLPATSADQKEKINQAIDNLGAGGSTAGGEGIKLAYRTARENFIKGGNNRVVLATDGDFNVGASSDESMEQLITKERESGVDLSIMGFGMGNLKDSKMEILADKGNGNYAYIDNMTEARKALVTEFGGTIFTVAKDVKLQLEFNPAKVQAYRLIGYENRMLAKEDFNNDKKDAGDMGSGHTVTALYEIIPVGVKDASNIVDPLKYQKVAKTQTSASDEMLTIKFRYKEPQGSVSKLSQAVVFDKPTSPDKLSSDHRFATAVAEIGMLLRGSEFKGDATFEQAIGIARTAKGNDDEGYRAEFIRLAETAAAMSRVELARK